MVDARSYLRIQCDFSPSLLLFLRCRLCLRQNILAFFSSFRWFIVGRRRDGVVRKCRTVNAEHNLKRDFQQPNVDRRERNWGWCCQLFRFDAEWIFCFQNHRKITAKIKKKRIKFMTTSWKLAAHAVGRHSVNTKTSFPPAQRFRKRTQKNERKKVSLRSGSALLWFYRVSKKYNYCEFISDVKIYISFVHFIENGKKYGEISCNESGFIVGRKI